MTTRFLFSIDDLEDNEIRSILDRAAALSRRRNGHDQTRDRVVGLVFLESSLRTRVGFTAAALRLGWYPIDVLGQRSGPTSMPESWVDTVRTVAGYVDGLVVRPGRPVRRTELAGRLMVPVINGGDTGPACEHPSQALIDLFAIERLGPVAERRIAICGDLRMRAVRSLLRVLSRTPPRTIALISDPALEPIEAVPPTLRGFVEYRQPWDVEDIDVLYVAGIPHGALPEAGRTRLRVDQRVLARLPRDAVVLSPMPVIDEIASNARHDPRVRMFEQSDAGLFVRMALLESILR